ncbi:restriction endonuclease subunit S [Vibrio tubiashii]|uniref:restriction endonuclease subunit S n=1 Tax=Vibrio tubiashii TaxID=29498 RepID=UPI00234E94DA|nr:restriction endonuclease subunit S [Vibrio tubiashii]WCP66712.1 restriction endonuclease subunit S [Vibrio tubiashii]
MRFKTDELTTYVSRGIAPKYTDIIDGAAIVVNQKCIRDYQVNLELARLNDLSKRKVPTEKLVQKYDVLVNSTGVGTLGRVGQFLGNEANLTVDTHVTIVRPDKDVIDPLFFGYLMKSKQRLIESFATGTTGQTELSRDSIKEMEVSFVENREHQQAIGNFLLAIDRKLQLNKATNQTLEEMAKAIFKSWFVDFDPVKAKMNGEQPEGMDAATASLFPEKLVESELGLIPEGWPVGKLSELIKFANGKSGTKSDSGQFPLYGANGIIGFSEEAKFEDAVIIGRVGAYCGAIEYCNSQFWASDNTIVATAKGGKAQLPFVLYLLKFLDLNQHAGGAAQPLLNQKVLNSLEVPIPSNAVLERYGELLATMLDKMTHNIEENHNLESLRETLLPKLLSGEIELGQAQELAEVE